METKINIAEILKNKPKGTKLHSSVYGDVKLELITEEDSKYPVITMVNAVCGIEYISFTENGLHYEGYPGAELALFPSSKMRDWSKFAWKKGDVLTNSSGFKVFFDKWVNEDYTKFLGKIKVLGDSHYYYYDTAYYVLASKKEALEFIKSVEEINNGKPNLKTLEIEKQPEFKDGDIVTMHKKNCDIVFIFNRLRTEGSFYYYAFHTLQTNNTGVIDCRITLPCAWTFFGGKMNFATDSEKQQLFDALAKEGKRWDIEKKQIVDLKLKWTPKPFDKVVVRCGKADKWSIDFFSYKVSNGYICIGDAWFGYCLPYNEETAHLLGTTDDWEGGEQ